MKHRITVVPLGPGSPDLLTLQAADLLRGGTPVCLRTERHPVSDWLKQQGVSCSSLDSLYENSDDFDAMNEAIVEKLFSMAASGDLLYAVPDPAADQSVSLLVRRADPTRFAVSVLPGVSAVDSCLAACASRTESLPLQSVSALSLNAFSWNPAASLLVTELDSRLLAGEVKLKLGTCLDDLAEVVFLEPSDEILRKPKGIHLCELDRQKRYDQTAALFVPGQDLLHRKRFCFEDLVRIMARLRARDGCPWDQVQTHDSLKPYLVEEAWETVDAIDRDEPDHLADELGDVLLQVVFHAAVGESFDEFNLTDVITHICRKMIVRHPRLFAGAAVLPDQPASVDSVQDWEKIKQMETGSKTVGESLEDVSSSLPSLKYAAKINKKLSQLPAFRQNPAEVAREIKALAASLLDGNHVLDGNAVGKLLIRCMELCRLHDQDGEILLHEAVNRLKTNYQQAEKRILRDGRQPENLTFAEMSEYLARTETNMED